MSQIDADTLMLRPIHREAARALLNGRIPKGMRFAPGYPSLFSLEVMELVVGAREPGRFRPFFMVRKADGAVVGEIGCSVDRASGTGQVGYTVVEPLWGCGYATNGLRALLRHVLAEPGVRRVLAQTVVDNTASRRVMEKAGMRYYGRRVRVEYGKSVDLVVYEAVAGSIGSDSGGAGPRAEHCGYA